MTSRLGWIAAAAAVLVGCAQPPRPPDGLLDVAERPAEKALLTGLRLYEDAQYEPAELQLTTALRSGLTSRRDRAAAHKHLAFIYCTSFRPGPCAAAFKEARRADPEFALSRSEGGHPIWGPVYRQALP